MVLLPLALAVFIDVPSKRLALKVVVAICLAGALVSFVTAATATVVSPRLYGGIVFQNYATQGMALSLGAIVCIGAMLRPREFAGDRLLGNRWLMAGVLAALVVDVVFVLWGRTGYLSMIVMSLSIAVLLAPGTWRVKLAAGSVIVAACVAIMLASPQVRGRLAQVHNDIATVDQSAQGTPTGARLVMWRNTLRMIADYPILGVGTGQFQSGYAPYVQGVSGWRGNLTDDPHNQFLKLQGEFGILGLGAYLFYLYTALRYPAPTPYRELATAALIGWCAASFVNSDFSTQAEGRLISFWLGAMLGFVTPAAAKG